MLATKSNDWIYVAQDKIWSRPFEAICDKRWDRKQRKTSIAYPYDLLPQAAIFQSVWCQKELARQSTLLRYRNCIVLVGAYGLCRAVFDAYSTYTIAQGIAFKIGINLHNHATLVEVKAWIIRTTSTYGRPFRSDIHSTAFNIHLICELVGTYLAYTALPRSLYSCTSSIYLLYKHCPKQKTVAIIQSILLQIHRFPTRGFVASNRIGKRGSSNTRITVKGMSIHKLGPFEECQIIFSAALVFLAVDCWVCEWMIALTCLV